MKKVAFNGTATPIVLGILPYTNEEMSKTKEKTIITLDGSCRQ
jgi:hypothetical protein